MNPDTITLLLLAGSIILNGINLWIHENRIRDLEDSYSRSVDDVVFLANTLIDLERKSDKVHQDAQKLNNIGKDPKCSE